MMSKQLLHTPEGIRDIYGLEYKKKLAIQEKIRKSIKSFGYEAIQTPTFEYIDVFSKEIGTTASKNLYKLIDKDGEMLALRPDFTPAVARCAAKYFMSEQKPLRLAYEGNTFVNTSHLQGKLKETTQMGAELIMDGSVEADAELLAMVVAALQNSDIVIRDSRSILRTFCWTGDAVRGIVALAESNRYGKGLDVVNFGGNEPITLEELARKIVSMTHSRSRIIPEPRPNRYVWSKIADIELAERRFGWQPEVTLDEGLSRMIELLDKRLKIEASIYKCESWIEFY